LGLRKGCEGFGGLDGKAWTAMTRHFRLSLLLTLAALTALVSWMGIQVHQNVTRLIAISGEVERSRARLDRLREAMVLLNDAETSQRGMLLTGKADYLQTYASSRARLTGLVNVLAAEVAGKDLRHLASAIDEKFAELARTLELDAAGDHSAAIALVRSGRGESLKREIVARIERIGAIERDRLGTLKREASESATGSLSWLMGRLGLTAFMALGLYAIIAAEIRRRHRVEAVLLESEARFRGGFEAAAIGMAMVAPDGRFLQVNRALSESVGYSKQELLARDFQSITHPDDLGGLQVQIDQLLAAPTGSFRLEKRYLHKGGQVVYVVIGVSLVSNDAGRALYFVAQIEDVTARVLAEQRAEERRFIESVADALPLTLYLFDLVEQRIVWANERITELFGLSPRELTATGDSIVERLVHPEDRPVTVEHMGRAAAARDGEIIEVEYRVRQADGLWHWIRSRDVVFLRDADGRVRQLLGMGEDVTERRRATVELARTRAQLADAIESLDSGLVMYDANEQVVVCNRRYREIYAAAADLMIPGIPYEAFLRAFYERSTWPERSPSLEEFVSHHLSSHRSRRGVHEQQLGDRWLRVGDFPTAEGGVVSLRTDITEMKRTEEDLRRALDAARAAERAKADFLANMSHEIRTPMNGVLGMAELALDTPMTPRQREYAATIKSSAESLLTVINDILDFSKVEAGKLALDRAPFSLRACIDDTLRTFAQSALAKGLELRAHVDPETPDLLLGDPHRLRQVLLNLVANAIKFTERGEVVLSVGPGGYDEPGDLIAFSVLDTGIGIPEGRRAAIFKPFEQADSSTTRRFGGTGLGLAIAAKLVALMDGSIRVDGRPGGGSCFRFTARFGRPTTEDLPTVDALKPDVDDLVRSAGPLRILLVEDNPVNQLVALHMLERLGHHATAVGDGRAALAALDSRLFDLVLMDVQMPEMDGFEAVTELRRLEAHRVGKRTPVVALTAYAMAGDRNRCLDAGFDAYLSKPIRIAELSQTLAAIALTLPDRGAVVFRPESLAELCGGDTEIITDVLETFLNESPATFDSIKKALESGDSSALHRGAHGLKGGCQTVGADALAATCRLLENLDDPARSALTFRNRVDHEWSALVRAIESHLQEMRAVQSV